LKIKLRTLWRRLIRLGFRLLYNELAWTYDAVSWLVSLGAWRDWQKSALPFIIGDRILEVGHGTGHMLAALESGGRWAVGLDISANMGRMAKGRTSAELVRGRVEEMPFKAATFDAALSTFPTEAIVSPEALAAVNRVLKPGGAFIVVPEGHLTGSSLLHRLIEWLFQITSQQQGSFTMNDPAERPELNPWQIFRLQFEAAGFVVSLKQIPMRRSAVTVLVARKYRQEIEGERENRMSN